MARGNWGAILLLHSFEFAVSVKTTQNQSTLLDGRRCVPLEASSPFELPKNPTSSVLSKKGGRKPNLCPGAGRAGTLNTHTRLLALSPHSRKGEAGPVPPGAPQGRSQGGGGTATTAPRVTTRRTTLSCSDVATPRAESLVLPQDPRFCLPDPSHQQSHSSFV